MDRLVIVPHHNRRQRDHGHKNSNIASKRQTTFFTGWIWKITCFIPMCTSESYATLLETTGNCDRIRRLIESKSNLSIQSFHEFWPVSILQLIADKKLLPIDKLNPWLLHTPTNYLIQLPTVKTSSRGLIRHFIRIINCNYTFRLQPFSLCQNEVVRYLKRAKGANNWLL